MYLSSSFEDRAVRYGNEEGVYLRLKVLNQVSIYLICHTIFAPWLHVVKDWNKFWQISSPGKPTVHVSN